VKGDGGRKARDTHKKHQGKRKISRVKIKIKKMRVCKAPGRLLRVAIARDTDTHKKTSRQKKNI
jgi:hypothetical protein